MYCNRRWIENEGCYILEFRAYDSWVEILRMQKVKDEDNCWIYTSDIMHVEYDYIFEDNIECAKDTCEKMYEACLEDEINYLREIMNMWLEEE